MGLLIALAAYGAVFRLSRGGSRVAGKVFGLTALASVVATVVIQIYPAFAVYRSNSEFIRNAKTNFRMPSDNQVGSQPGGVNKLNVVLYIGESTSSINYGPPPAGDIPR